MLISSNMFYDEGSFPLQYGINGIMYGTPLSKDDIKIINSISKEGKIILNKRFCFGSSGTPQELTSRICGISVNDVSKYCDSPSSLNLAKNEFSIIDDLSKIDMSNPDSKTKIEELIEKSKKSIEERNKTKIEKDEENEKKN